MTNLEYEHFVEEGWIDKSDPLKSLFVMTTGLGGEAGEVQDILKKWVDYGRIDLDHLREELGDTLHYLTRIAIEFGMSLDDVRDANVAKLTARRASNDPTRNTANGWRTE